jgi:hypothetical protein
MRSHFQNSIDRCIAEINKTPSTNSHNPYLSVNLQKAISIRVFYDTGADISCLKEKVFHTSPPRTATPPPPISNQNPWILPLASFFHHGDRDLDICIGDKTLRHPVHVIKNLLEDVILGIDFIHAHKISFCPEMRAFAWGTANPRLNSRHPKIH